MYRYISQQTKEIALSLWSRGYSPEDITEILGMTSKRSLYRWQETFDAMGTVIRPTIRGADRRVTRAVMSEVYVVLQAHPDAYLDELVLWLAIHHDIVISRSSLHETLQRHGLTRKLLQKVALERDEQLRQEWQELLHHENISGEGWEFICVDETSKDERTYARHYGWSLQGQSAVLEDVFVRGVRWSVTCALTVDGYIAADAVEGSYDSHEFYEFIAEQVVPQMRPFPDVRSVLVLDNCRIHHSQALVDLIEAAGCLLLYLPAYSPDLNPIEESFSTVKAYIRRWGSRLRLEEDPHHALLEATGCVTPEMAKGWFRHAGYIH